MRSQSTRTHGPLVLAVDLETIAQGRSEATERLSERLKRRPHTSVVYVAVDRSQHSADVCIRILGLPPADAIVADGGASVRAARPHPGLAAVDRAIGQRWPGAYAVRSRVQTLGHLLGESRFEEARRVSYFPRDREVPIEAVQTAIATAVADLDVDIRVNRAGQIDVLPEDTDMARTIMLSLEALNASPSWVVVAGGLTEPRFIQDAGYWGIATGDTPTSVRAALVHSPRVHITNRTGPDAVLDGLLALGFLAAK